MNMTKKDKRRYNQKKLKDTIQTNNFIKDKFYKGGNTYKKVKLTCDSICGVVQRYNLCATEVNDEFEEEED